MLKHVRFAVTLSKSSSSSSIRFQLPSEGINKDYDKNGSAKIKTDWNFATARKKITKWTESHAIQKLRLHLRYNVQDKSKSNFSFLIAISRFRIVVLDLQVSLKKLMLKLSKSAASFVIRSTLKKNYFSVYLLLARVSARRSQSKMRRFYTFESNFACDPEIDSFSSCKGFASFAFREKTDPVPNSKCKSVWAIVNAIIMCNINFSLSRLKFAYLKHILTELSFNSHGGEVKRTSI